MMKVLLNTRSNIGYVKGLSMWPNLVPGDILKTQPRLACMLKPDMITVLNSNPEEKTIVHRIQTVRNFSNCVIVSTYGDRGGKDPERYIFSSHDITESVSGVLRAGRYRTVSKLKLPLFLSYKFSTRLLCWIVRHFFW